MNCEKARITMSKMLDEFVRPSFENNLKDEEISNDFIQRNTLKIYPTLTIQVSARSKVIKCC